MDARANLNLTQVPTWSILSHSVNPDSVRAFLYDEIIEHARWPALRSIAAHFGLQVDAARDALRNLKIGKTALVDPRNGELWMAGPFAGTETPYRVRIGEKSWWANCAWDMLGIVTMVGSSAQVDARCTDCGEAMNILIDAERGPAMDGVVHFLVPASRWYDDIGYT